MCRNCACGMRAITQFMVEPTILMTALELSVAHQEEKVRFKAAAASPFGIGSDIGGSIRMPAFFNGIFGHKPSSTGPMCRFASDLKPMMKVLVEDEYVDKLKLDKPVDLKKLKVYYQENDGGGFLVSPVDKDLQQALTKVVNYFKNSLKVEVNRVQITRCKNTGAMWLANMKSKDLHICRTSISTTERKCQRLD
ncbi:hypothetical protein PVAND_010677 [Polypedilum vanderplanki]|uniref:Amidase domain-containing protein n=1 Tax=Polypedilum vanderplanki TaxID=319348 RepID=A0A9J6CH80_POLVA|nr:hypothetical protein PVAND_010677 [Polypedilum vanderplanki]